VPSVPTIDRASLEALRRGDPAELNRIISRWQRPLIGFAFRYVQNAADAEDLVAETLARLYAERGRLREGSNLSAWLFTTLTNLCHNLHRWRKRHPAVSIEERAAGGAAEIQGSEPRQNADLEHAEALSALRQAVEALPHDLKATVLLHHYQHLSYGEIAVITGCSERGVETRLYRARQQLRGRLAGFLAQDPAR
jgi:RNA polymerase sigma-70 factor (ECF subfamily)